LEEHEQRLVYTKKATEDWAVEIMKYHGNVRNDIDVERRALLRQCQELHDLAALARASVEEVAQLRATIANLWWIRER
jgi:hypothetical protein